MNKVWVLGDTHFGHAKVAVARGFSSVEEHDEYLRDEWNNTVRPKDTVWVLGDVAFGLESLNALSGLHGYKKLVLGNHDHFPTTEYLRHFERVYGAAQVKGVLLTHIPVHPAQLARFSFNVHGHLHGDTVVPEDPRYACVSLERTGLRPVLLDDVLSVLHSNSKR